MIYTVSQSGEPTPNYDRVVPVLNQTLHCLVLHVSGFRIKSIPKLRPLCAQPISGLNSGLQYTFYLPCTVPCCITKTYRNVFSFSLLSIHVGLSEYFSIFAMRVLLS